MDPASFVKSQFQRDLFTIEGGEVFYRTTNHSPKLEIASLWTPVVVTEKRGAEEHGSGLTTFKFRLEPKPNWLWNKIFNHVAGDSGKITVREDELHLLSRPIDLGHEYSAAKEVLQGVNKMHADVVPWIRAVATKVQEERDSLAAAEMARREGVQSALASLKL